MTSKVFMGFDLDKLIVGGVAAATAGGVLYLLIQEPFAENEAPADPSAIAARLAPIGVVALTPPPALAAPAAKAEPAKTEAAKPEAKAEPAAPAPAKPTAAEAPKAEAAQPAAPKAAPSESAAQVAAPAAPAAEPQPAAAQPTQPAAAAAPTIVLPNTPVQTSTTGAWKPHAGMPWTPAGNPIGNPVERR